MEVEISNQLIVSNTFNDLKSGDTFIFINEAPDEIKMKIDSNKYFKLKEGQLVSFNSIDTSVKKIKAKILIQEI